jgi:ferredoxin
MRADLHFDKEVLMPKVSIKGTPKIFEITEGQILFDALADQGEKLPHGCLAGSCGACRIEVFEGRENLAPPSTIEQNTLDDITLEFKKKFGPTCLSGRDLRLSCRLKIFSDLTFRPLKNPQE